MKFVLNYRSPQIFIYLVLFFVFFDIPLAFASLEHSKGFRSASQLINNGKYLEAIGVYSEIAANALSDNDRARAILFSGTIYDLYLDQPETALDMYKDLFECYPESPAAADALFNSGLVLYKTDKYQEAFDTYKSYIEKYPENMRRNSAKVWARKAKDNLSALPCKQSVKTLNLAFETEIRVLLETKAKQLIFSSPLKITISNPDTGKIIFSGIGPVVISRENSMMTINTEKISAKKCKIKSENNYMNIGKQSYRGSFVVHMTDRELTAVNHLDIEKYLYGVVPKEMSWLWSEEALKAQAIASRTYALYLREKQAANCFYDLAATTASQVYGGYDAEREQTDKAVDKTCGKVMLFNGKLIIAYFHANSGGYTESSKNVWGADIPYLKSSADKFSLVASGPEWILSLSYKQMGKLFQDSGLNIGKIKKIKFYQRSGSGRINSFDIFADKGKIRLTGNNFRMKIGATSLKSTCFKTSISKSRIIFKGRGYGHGVGMSQWGAHQMALADYSCADILSHYYKGIEIADAVYK